MFHDFCSETTRHRFTFKMKVRFRSKVSWCKFHGPGETSYSKKIWIKLTQPPCMEKKKIKKKLQTDGKIIKNNYCTCVCDLNF